MCVSQLNTGRYSKKRSLGIGNSRGKKSARRHLYEHRLMGASGLYNAISTGFMDSAFDDMPTNGGTEEKKRVYVSCKVRSE